MPGLIERMRYDGATGCWNWTGSEASGGYGRVAYRGRDVRVHRLAAHLWLRFDLKSHLQVLHRCDNPLCFNPKHLFLGTSHDNMRDCVAKKRHFQSKKTECYRGHPFDEANTKIYQTKHFGPRRTCRICSNLMKARRRQRKKVLQIAANHIS